MSPGTELGGSARQEEKRELLTREPVRGTEQDLTRAGRDHANSEEDREGAWIARVRGV